MPGCPLRAPIAAMAELQARWHQSLSAIPEDCWDRLLTAAHPQELPFYRWRWLHQLEASGSIVPREGWQGCHLGLWRGEQLVAVAPLWPRLLLAAAWGGGGGRCRALGCRASSLLLRGRAIEATCSFAAGNGCSLAHGALAPPGCRHLPGRPTRRALVEQTARCSGRSNRALAAAAAGDTARAPTPRRGCTAATHPRSLVLLLR